MTALRQPLIDDLHLRGHEQRTVETYVVDETVVGVSKHIGKSRAPLAHDGHAKRPIGARRSGSRMEELMQVTIGPVRRAWSVRWKSKSETSQPSQCGGQWWGRYDATTPWACRWVDPSVREKVARLTHQGELQRHHIRRSAIGAASRAPLPVPTHVRRQPRRRLSNLRRDKRFVRR